MIRAGLALALLASGTLAAAATTATAQTPPPAPQPTTVTAIGSASVAVRRPARLTDATIGEAVRAARVEAGPKAVADARQEAERMASALGLQLGALQAVAEESTSPFGPFGPYGGVDGTFGPGRYCGTIRRRLFRPAADGRRVATGRVRTRDICRVPPSVTAAVAVTYSAG